MGTRGITITLPVLGVEVTFICGNSEIQHRLQTIFPATGLARQHSEIVLELRQNRRKPRQLERPPRFQLEGDRLTGHSGASSFSADRKTMRGEASLCAEMLSNLYLLRHQILNSMAYFLLSFRYLTPVHCACLSHGRRTFLFVGRSGSGKSTLALAALHRGMPVLAEDIAFLMEDEGELSVHSDCREIHCSPNVLSLVSGGITHNGPVVSHNGKAKYVIPVPEHLRSHCGSDITLILLEPSHRQIGARLRSLDDRQEILAGLLPREEGFRIPALQRQHHFEILRTRPVYIATVGQDVPGFLDQLLALDACCGSCVSRKTVHQE